MATDSNRATALVLLIAGAIAAGGCGGAGGDDAESSTPLGDAAGEVASSGEVTSLTWVDTARLREVAGLPESIEEAARDEQWSVPVGLAIGLDAFNGGTDLGFDPLAGDRTITIGQPPDDATRFDGVEGADVEAALTDLGFESTESDGTEYLALGDEGEIVTDALDEFGAGPIGLNRVRIEGDSVAAGAYEDAVDAAFGDGDPLIDEPGFAAMVDCMGGDAIAASIRDPEGGAAEEVALSGVGLSATGPDDATDILCAAGDDGASLDGVADSMEKAFNQGGVDPAVNTPYSEILGEAEIESGDTDGSPWVRASFAVGDRPVGVVFKADLQGSLAPPLGGEVPLP